MEAFLVGKSWVGGVGGAILVCETCGGRGLGAFLVFWEENVWWPWRRAWMMMERGFLKGRRRLEMLCASKS